MKKVLIIIATTIMATTAWAQSQQLLSVKGKTKDGKSINVQYYKGTAQDYIESVKYQLVDELKVDNKNKQNSINDLQTQLNKANKKIDQLNVQLKKSGSSDQSAELQEQLNQKQSEIDQLTEQNRVLSTQLNETKAENEKLKRQLDSIKAVNLRLSQNKNRPSKNPIIGVEANMGSVFQLGNDLSALSWDKQVAVYYGTDRLSKNIPVSIEVGLGFRNLPMSAKADDYTASESSLDPNDEYQLQLKGYSETLTMNCLEIPVRFCLGQPNKSKVSVYTKLGVTPSYILSANQTNSAYSIKGYYPKWNVTFENIEELGFIDVSKGDQKMTPEKPFNLWGNAAFGAYVPLGSSLLFNIGAKVDCPIMKTTKFKKQEGSASETSSFQPLSDFTLRYYNGRMLNTSLQLGLIYSLNNK